ncbi:cadherin-like beta sandwich domain-containing protein [Paenibacillus sp. 1001270B_150601_E10]|uniref:cadherin-like beta sandwich domain-containing protein n=1 Tax=Paenibacillus sp. 1001270B_150601_E10 TaxID=2787079 RepID=UPI00189F0EA6|nr:cadherin-like beta sandwich domain-containing protein [Paenibacillus sp. 1001270B_150601_E10]
MFKGKAFTSFLAVCMMAYTMIPVYFPMGGSFAYAEEALQGPVAVPVPSKPTGRYEEAVQISLESSTDGVAIYYTLDGTLPDQESLQYVGTPITLTKTTNLSVIAYKEGAASRAATYAYLIKSKEKPLLQFVAMSDMHVGYGKDEEAYKARYASFFDTISSIFTSPDAILLAGDMINDNGGDKQNEHPLMRDLVQEQLERKQWNQTAVQIAIGNHDWTVAKLKEHYPQEWFTDQSNGYYEKSIGGYSFFFLNGNNYNADAGQRTWLKSRLTDLTADPANKNKPIFVSVHQPVSNTVLDGQQASNPNLYTDLQDFPQVIVLSGHSHLNINDDRSIHQKDFTSINLGSMSYIETDRGYSAVTNKGLADSRFEFPVLQAQFIEVYEDRVEVDRIAFNADQGDILPNGVWTAAPVPPFYSAGSVAGESWTIALKGETNDEIKQHFTYTSNHRNKVAPQFPVQTELKVTPDEQGVPVLSFRQAKDDQSTYGYEIVIKNKRTAQVAKTYKVLSDFYFSPIPNRMNIPMTGLEAGAAYSAAITAIDAYGNRSNSLTTTFQTGGEPPEITPIDPETMWKQLVSDMRFESNLSDEAKGAESMAAKTGNVAFVEGRSGKAISIAAGNGNYIDLGNRTDLRFGSGSFTISFWHQGNLAADQTVQSNKDWNSGKNPGWYIGPAAANSMTLNMGDGTNRIDARAGSVGSEWHHFTISVDREKKVSNIYIDGVVKQTTDLTNLGTSSMDTANSIVIGADGRKNYGNAAVTLDDLRIWKRALTAQEAKALSDSYKTNTLYTFGQLQQLIGDAERFYQEAAEGSTVSVPEMLLAELQAQIISAKSLTAEENEQVIDQAYVDLMWALQSAREGAAYSFIPKANMTVEAYSSYADNENAYPEHLLDGSLSTIWHSRWLSPVPNFPHWVILDLKNTHKITGVQRTSRLSQTAMEFPKDFELYASDNFANLSDEQYLGSGENKAAGSFGKTWSGNAYKDYVKLDRAVQGRYVKFLVTSTYNTPDKTFTSLSELDFTGEAAAAEHAKLVDLKVNGATLPGFKPDQYEYALQVPADASKLDITYATAEQDATVEVAGHDKLKIGENIVTITVTAHGEKRVYTIKAAKQASQDHALYLAFENSLKDYSSFDLKSTIVGDPEYVAGRLGKAIQLKTLGSSNKQLLNLGKPAALQFSTDTNFTLGFWIKSNPTSGDPAILSNKDWNSGSNVGYVLALVGSTLKWNYNTQGGKRADAEIPNVADGSWHHIMVSHDRKTGRVDFYKDGAPVDIKAVNGSKYQGIAHSMSIEGRTGTVDSGLSTVIGNDGTSNYDQTNQIQMDEVQILRRAVTAEEVQREYDQAPPIVVNEKFAGTINVLGAKHAVQDAQVRYFIDLRTPTMTSRIDKVKLDVSYDPAALEFVSASRALGVDSSTPGLLKLELQGGYVYSETDPLEYAVSRLSELRFQTRAAQGEVEIGVTQAEFYQGNTQFETERLDANSMVTTIHGKQAEDLNKDGYITVGDVALSTGLSEEEQSTIASKTTYQPYKRVVVIGIDGGGAAVTKDAPYWETPSTIKEKVGDRLKIPTIRRLIESGAVSYTAQTTLPSSSSPNWGALMNGVGYEKHGLYNDDTAKFLYSETWEYATIFKKLKEYLPANKLAAFATWGNIVEGHYELSAGVEGYKGLGDKGTIEAFKQYVAAGKAKDTALMFFQLDELDGVGHGDGFYTKKYYEKLTAIDKHVEAIYNTLQDHDLLEDTLIIIVPDHGGGTENANGTLGSATSHGQDSPLAKTIFFAANGRTVGDDSGNEKLLQGGATRDLPATILTALGLPPTLGDSHVIEGMFTPQPELNKALAPTLQWMNIQSEETGKTEGYEVWMKEASADIHAIELKAYVGSNAAVQAFPAQSGVRILHQEQKDGMLRIVLFSEAAIKADQPIMKLALPSGHTVEASAHLVEGMLADANGRELLPNLAVDQRIGTDTKTKLKELKINDTPIQGFDPNKLDYAVSVPHAVTDATVTYVTYHPDAQVEVQGGKDLQVGLNDVKVKVTTADTGPTIYSIQIVREGSGVPTPSSLLDLRLNGTTIVGFSPDIYTYRVTVPYSTTVSEVTYAAMNPAAIVTVQGSKDLVVGDNLITVSVVSPTGGSSLYSIVVTREEEQASSNANLLALQVNGVPIRDFQPDKLQYTVDVSYTTTVALVTYAAQDPQAAVVVTGGDYLAVGNNTITVKVTAKSGAENVFIIQVRRKGDSAPSTPSPFVPVNPGQMSELPKDAVTVPADALAGQSKQISVQLKNEKERVLLTMDQLAAWKEQDLYIRGEDYTLVISAKQLKALHDSLASRNKEESLSIRMVPVADEKRDQWLKRANQDRHAQYHIGGDLLDVSIYFTDKTNRQFEVKKLEDAMKLLLAIPSKMDVQLAGMYQFASDGTFHYRSRELSLDNNQLELAIHETSIYGVMTLNKDYTDVKESHWAYRTIQQLSAHHIVKGASSSSFNPSGQVSRAEFAAWLVRAMGLSTEKTASFHDVEQGAWYAKEVAAAYEAGLVTGRSVDAFEPNSSITREEMAMMLVRAKEQLTGTKLNAGVAAVKDASQISAWARANVLAALQAELMRGRPGEVFAPAALTTRAEAAQAVYNLLHAK